MNAESPTWVTGMLSRLGLAILIFQPLIFSAPASGQAPASGAAANRPPAGNRPATAGSAGARTPEQARDDAATAVADPLREELRRRARGDQWQLASALRDALRLRFDVDANRFLEALKGKPLTDDQRAAMVDTITTASLLRVATSDAFSADAKGQAAELIAGKRRFAGAPERIAAAIGELVSDDPERQSAAAKILVSAGEGSIGPLAEAAAAEANPGRRDKLLQGLRGIGGEEGLEALEHLAIYGDPTLRDGAIRAIQRLRPDAAMPHLLTAAVEQGGSPQLRQSALATLDGRLGRRPGPAEAETYLLDRLRSQRDQIAHLADPQGPAVTWVVDDQGRKLSPQPTTRHGAASRKLVDTARLMQRVAGLSTEARREALAAEMAYLVQVDPVGLEQQRDQLAALWGKDLLAADALGVLIDEAILRGDLASAVAGMNLIGPATPGDRMSLVGGSSGSSTPLVKAVMHPVAEVRYAAAAAIGRLGIDAPYVGSSTVATRWAEMAKLDRLPTALIVETRAELKNQIEPFITSLGYRVEVASSVDELVRRISLGGDLRFVIATSELPDRTALEFVDLVRRQPFGERLPIFLHGSPSLAKYLATEERRWEAPVVPFEIPVTAEGWGVILEGVIDQPQGALRGLQPLTAIQRDEFRRQAAIAMGRAASERKGEAGYDFDAMPVGELREAGLDGVQVPNVAFGEPQLAVLSASSSENAQASLANRLLDPAMPADRYGKVADAILGSFSRSGVQLDSATIRQLGAARRSATGDAQKAAIDRVITNIADRFGVKLANE